METKKYEEYTEEELKALLTHWLHHDVCELYTEEEDSKLQQLISKNPNQVFKIAVMSGTLGVSLLLRAIREDKVQELFDRSKILSQSSKSQIKFNKEAQLFIHSAVNSFNRDKQEGIQQEPSVVEEKIQQEATLTEQNVEKIFEDCLLKSDSPEEATIVAGVMTTAFFRTDKLNEHKKELIAMIDQLAKINKGPHFTSLCFTEEGNIWTENHKVIDELMILGLATEILQIPLDLPRAEWNASFPDGLPFVIRNHKKDNEKVVGENPNQWQKKK